MWRQFLQKKCPADNYHWKWDRLCFCHGGRILDLKTGVEYRRHVNRTDAKAAMFGLLYGASPNANGDSFSNLEQRLLAQRSRVPPIHRDIFPRRVSFLDNDTRFIGPDDEAEEAVLEVVEKQEAEKRAKEPGKDLWDHLKGSKE